MTLLVAPSVRAFLDNEVALRALHGPTALLVRPQSYTVPQAPGAVLVIGGWAFGGGEPAILPDGMHLLVITDTGPDGKQTQLARDPSAVLAVLGPYVTRHEAPCPHFTVRVPRAQLPQIRARIAAMPEHDPIAADHAPPTRRELFPVLKEPNWPHKSLVVWMPFPGVKRPDAPIIAFAEDTANGYVFLTKQDAPSADPKQLLSAGIASLRRRETDFAMVNPSIAVSAGRDLSAERLLDEDFLKVLHDKLGPEMWVVAPHRVALYALRAGASPADVTTFVSLVEHDTERAPTLGHALVSKLAFRVVNARVVDAVTLDALPRDLRQSLPPAGLVSARAPGPPSSLPPGVIQPAKVVLKDDAKKEINAVILVAGSGAKRFARTIFTATGGEIEGPPNDAEIEHYVLTMGDIRGWKIQFLFYAGDDSQGGLEVLAEYARHAAAVVLVQEGAHMHIEPGLLALAHAPRKPDAVVAFIGPAFASVGWAQASGAAAHIVEPLDDRTTMDTLKKIAKNVLGMLRSV
ncbi:MAG: hypothetical protein U0441_35085 [Polyangiaceae bacterium]